MRGSQVKINGFGSAFGRYPGIPSKNLMKYNKINEQSVIANLKTPSYSNPPNPGNK